MGKGELRISEKRIKEIHTAIMHEEADRTALIGEWKKTANEIINYKSEKISFTPPANVQAEIHELLNNTNAKLDAYFKTTKNYVHPLIIASDFHLGYVTIHPFYDGNGRTARILMNLILIACNYPPIIIKEADKNAYYQYLADIQVYGGDKNMFYEFMANKLLESQQTIISAINGENIEESDDVQKEIELLKIQLSNKELSKSPKIIFDVFNKINKGVWPKIADTLKLFDEFYNENKTEHFVNYDNEKYKTYTKSIHSILNYQTSDKPIELTIFGHNIYETDVKTVKWQHTKFGLKGSEKNSNAVTYLSIGFEQSKFELYFVLDAIKIFSKTYSYSSFVSMDEIDEMKLKLGKEFVKHIKENTGI